MTYRKNSSMQSKGWLMLLIIMNLGLWLSVLVLVQARDTDQSVTAVAQFDDDSDEQKLQLAQERETNVAQLSMPSQKPRPEGTGQDFFVYLPIITLPRPLTPFGLESNSSLTANSNQLLERTENLGVSWIRRVISWRKLQPDENGPIQWEQLSDFEEELRALKKAHITPLIVVIDSPKWATINDPWPTSCGAIRAEKFEAFAQFMSTLASRYSQSEFNVHYWELGNEPDVDPRLLDPDSVFGCWGNIDDPYYGGEHYGNMLKIVTPAMRATDPQVKIITGGLLLGSPNTTTPGHGRPELFLEGILRAGTLDGNYDYFDIVGYHGHSTYYAPNIDYTGDQVGEWGVERCGNGNHCRGSAKGKAIFLRDLMARYGVSKPLFLNESTLTCPVERTPCVESSLAANNSLSTVATMASSSKLEEQKALGAHLLYLPLISKPQTLFGEFQQQQAAHVSRVVIRSLNVGVMGFIWYTINGPGWYNGGLLDEDQNPRPVYYAYQNLIEQLGSAAMTPPQQIDELYAQPGIEAYRFIRNGKAIDVLWSLDGTALTVSLPASSYIAAYDKMGAELKPTLVGSDYQLTVDFDNIYIHRQP